MPLTRATLRDVGTPCIVLTPHQPKLGIRLPADLPVVVNADRMMPMDNKGQDRDKLLRWFHMFITLARASYRAGPRGRNYIAWMNGLVEEIDLEACIRCGSLKTRRVDRDTQYVELHGMACDDCMRLVPDAPSQ